MSETLTKAETFATREDASEDAALYYDLRQVRFHGCDARGWTWEYDPSKSLSVESDESVVLGCEYDAREVMESELCEDMTIAHTDDSDGSVAALTDAATAPEGWQVIDTTSDGATLGAIALVTGEATDTADTAEPTASTERQVIICIDWPEGMPERLARAIMEPMNKGKKTFSFVLRDASTFEVIPNPVAEGKASRASSGPSGPVCKVDGLDWSIEHCPDEGNRKACASMKRRVDDLARVNDLRGLKALSWAGCKEHASRGNTYQRQGGVYRDNWIAEVERRLAEQAAQFGI